MTMRVYVPCDAGAIAVGADDVAVALERAATARDIDIDIDIIRTGSRSVPNVGSLLLPPPRASGSVRIARTTACRSPRTPDPLSTKTLAIRVT